MFDKLQNYLSKWVDESKADYYLSALECLDRYGFVAAWSDISAMLEGEVNVPVSMLLDAMDEILQAGMDRVLGEHSISAHEAPLRSKTAILNGLKYLVDDSQHELIVAICDNGEDTLEQMAELLAIVDPEASASWVDYIDTMTFVSDGLITRLKDIHEQAIANRMPTEADSLPITPEKQQRFQKIRTFIGKYKESLATQAIISDGSPLGLPLEMVLETYAETMKSYDNKLPLTAAVDIVGIVLISDTPLDKLALRAKDLIDEIYADIDYIGLVAKAMESILNEVLLND